MPTYSFHPSLYVYFKKTQMNKLVVRFPTHGCTTPTELETNELVEGLLFCFENNEFAPKHKRVQGQKSIYELTSRKCGKIF